MTEIQIPETQIPEAETLQLRPCVRLLVTRLFAKAFFFCVIVTSFAFIALLLLSSYLFTPIFSSPWAFPSLPSLRMPWSTGVDVSWYPPSKTAVNDLESALHSKGTHGFIFNSSQTPQGKYGVYNWCNMPHVRASEYVEPSDEYTLVYVELMQRHHKRTPYAKNMFPVEAEQWDCDNTWLLQYALRTTTEDPARTFVKEYTSPINPFTKPVRAGTCRFPQITAGGLEDSWLHGKDLYGVYHDLLDFLPDGTSKECKGQKGGKVRKGRKFRKGHMGFRVTNNPITSQVAGLVVGAMGRQGEFIHTFVQPESIDSLEPRYPCPAGSKIFSEIQSHDNPAWEGHIKGSQSLFAALDDTTGVPTNHTDFHASFDRFYDNLSARQCHDKALPCVQVEGARHTLCASQDLADSVYRMGNWEYSQVYRDSPRSLEASVATFGVWIAELAANLRSSMAGANPYSYIHNVAHDGSVARVLSILQVDSMVWPGMGAEIVFELWKKSGKGKDPFRVRVLFGGRVLKSSSPTLGTMDMIPAETLLAYFDGLVGRNASLVKEKCF